MGGAGGLVVQELWSYSDQARLRAAPCGTVCSVKARVARHAKTREEGPGPPRRRLLLARAELCQVGNAQTLSGAAACLAPRCSSSACLCGTLLCGVVADA